jgi:phospholipid/cholesterol/gamma-HCH transport system substrate-binding protein
MLRRTSKIQLIIFVVITLLGLSYVSAEYVGLAKYLTGNRGCTVAADFPDSGGIFSGAEVTYRGVTVGRVGSLHLNPRGVRVDLHLDSCSAPEIPAPAQVSAIVADRSVVGEQYVDLEPLSAATIDHARYLAEHDVIPMANNRIPTATQTLLVDLDRLFNSVPLDDLRTTVHELGKSVAGRGNDLGKLIDATDLLINSAGSPENLSATIDLIDRSSSVLQTQLDQRDPLHIWTHGLNLLSQQVKTSNGDFAKLLGTGPGEVTTVRNFVAGNATDLGVTLANLSTVGDLLVRHIDGIEQIFELYPALAAGGPTAAHDRAGWLGLVLQPAPDPQDCGDPKKGREGYGGTHIRDPNNGDALAPMAPNVAARCTASATGPDGKNVRGSAHVPGGDPTSLSGGGYAYPRTVTSNTLRVGTALPTSDTLADASWLGLVTDSLR